MTTIYFENDGIYDKMIIQIPVEEIMQDKKKRML